MNERIDELATQSGLHKEWFIDNPELEKFAEMIVQECLLAISKTDVTDEEIPAMVKCHNQVEQHFGIKE